MTGQESVSTDSDDAELHALFSSLGISGSTLGDKMESDKKEKIVTSGIESDKKSELHRSNIKQSGVRQLITKESQRSSVDSQTKGFLRRGRPSSHAYNKIKTDDEGMNKIDEEMEALNSGKEEKNKPWVIASPSMTTPPNDSEKGTYESCSNILVDKGMPVGNTNRNIAQCDITSFENESAYNDNDEYTVDESVTPPNLNQLSFPSISTFSENEEEKFSDFFPSKISTKTKKVIWDNHTADTAISSIENTTPSQRCRRGRCNIMSQRFMVLCFLPVCGLIAAGSYFLVSKFKLQPKTDPIKIVPINIDVKEFFPASADPPTDIQITRAEEIIAKLASVIGEGVFLNDKSSQHHAAFWIISEDEKNISAGDPSLVQRYVLAALYFATTPNHNNRHHAWKKCGMAPSRQMQICEYKLDKSPHYRFLSTASECEWFGVACNSNGDVIRINVGTYFATNF